MYTYNRQGSIWSLEIFYIKFLIDFAFKLNFFISSVFILKYLPRYLQQLFLQFFSFIYYCYEVFIYSIIITH